jgi:hypothetical protein
MLHSSILPLGEIAMFVPSTVDGKLIESRDPLFSDRVSDARIHARVARVRMRMLPISDRLVHAVLPAGCCHPVFKVSRSRLVLNFNQHDLEVRSSAISSEVPK